MNSPAVTGQPVFSVVVPSRNRPEALRSCLESLAAMDYGRSDFEVVVIDDGGRVSPELVIEPFRTAVAIRLLRTEGVGPAAARNAGAAAGRGRFLAFTDDDCRPDSGWLRALETKLLERQGCGVAGARVNGLPEELCAEASQTIADAAARHFNSGPGDAGFLSTSNAAFPAPEFRALGGFDESFRTAEDREFGDRWRRAGHPLLYAPDAVVHHFHPLNFAALCRRHFQIGRGARRYFLKRKRAHGGGVQPDLRFYRKLLRLPFERNAPWRGLLMAFLVVAAQAANAVGYVYERTREAGSDL